VKFKERRNSVIWRIGQVAHVVYVFGTDITYFLETHPLACYSSEPKA
jgi:hypothetical protein